MARLIKANEALEVRRRVYFHLVQEDGLTPAVNESGKRPQVSIDGGEWSATGIGVLSHIGSGRYYAALEQSILVAGRHLETRFSSLATAEIPGDSVDVVAFNPYDAATLGLTAVAELVETTQEIDDNTKNPKNVAILPGHSSPVTVTTDTQKGKNTGISITTGVERVN